MLKYKNQLLAVLLSALLCGMVYVGYGEENYTVDVCRSTVSKYVTADFSEIVTGIDFEGNLYTELDSWSEPASEVYTETVVNDIPVFPPMPEHDISINKESNFDRFRFHTNTKLTIEAYNSEDRKSFTEDIIKAPNCINMIDRTVSVKTWWTITYGSDFSA